MPVNVRAIAIPSRFPPVLTNFGTKKEDSSRPLGGGCAFYVPSLSLIAAQKYIIVLISQKGSQYISLSILKFVDERA
jgi:hypothetical protein